ncbi:hypothetical protein [Helicobacter cetorum]|uniref:Uncharacterized protein n=1 Tax=Helicobacter cetorum (strain ATCC BAA-540 / CCUG 52418 / MIT 99-5656) TaxID=1163745 RepID=I0ESK9_HELCM|nr:hypothetical protein [Helicobacter cetorum]AFI05928.1 hypothetical protein HCD_04610 [Helicobacter cetorum MIT 99-5656]
MKTLILFDVSQECLVFVGLLFFFSVLFIYLLISIRKHYKQTYKRTPPPTNLSFYSHFIHM